MKREQAEKRNALHKRLKPLKEAYAGREAELEGVLTEQAEVEQLLADPDIFADRTRTSELLARFEHCRTESERLLEQLAALEEEIRQMETASLT